jgi:uncharacterized membrane protein YphA (DoxX/SURF4 family)
MIFATWRQISDRLGTIARWSVGGVFVYMGAAKALHPENFLKLVHEYDLPVGYFWLNATAALLPWLEIFCGLLLLTGIAVRGASLLLAIMLIGFTGLIGHRAWQIMSAQAIPFWAVRFDCGCGNGEMLAGIKILENIGLLLFLWLFLGGLGKMLCLRHCIFSEADKRGLCPDKN